MRNIWIIAWKDFRSYFNSPIAYIVIVVFLFLAGFLFYNNLAQFHEAISSQRNPMMGPQSQPMSLLVRQVFGNMNVIFLFAIPFVTMRLIAEERKMHTYELLAAAPIPTLHITLGKFLSAVLFLITMVAPTLTFMVILGYIGNPDWGVVASCYLGTILMGSCYVAAGLFASSLTENQIVAGLLALMFNFFFWLVSWPAQMAGRVWGEIFTYLSLVHHYNNMSKGLLATPDIVFFLSFAGAFVFLANQVLQSYRWR